jgi:hypothetical protein
MPRYGFTNPGANAGNAIQQFLMQQMLMERERLEQERAAREEAARMQQQAEQRKMAQQQLELQQQQEQRIAAAQQQQQADLENERNFRRATTIADSAMPGDAVDAQTAELLRAQGYGGQMTQGQPTQGAQIGEEEGIPLYDVIPGVMQMRGGSKYLGQRQAAQERADLAAQGQAAAAERAAADRSFREEMARMQAGNRGELDSARAETARLNNEIAGVKLEREKAANEQERAWRDKTGEDSRRVTENALALARRARSHPGLRKTHGIISSRISVISQDAADYKGIRDQLVAALTLPNLGALKGPMSDKDVKFVKDLATRLANDQMSDEEAVRAIDEAISFLESKLAASGGGEDAGPRKPTAQELIDKYRPPR